jgi:two-component system response regulator QseB
MAETADIPESLGAVLLVEDDSDVRGMLARLLRSEGYQVDEAADGQHGLHLALSRSYQVLILDRGLPAVDGLDLLARLRRQGADLPVLILSARGSVADRVAGLDAGAEDYLVKPFDLDELLARVRALMRRHLRSAAQLPIGGGLLDVPLRVVRPPGAAEVPLSGREFDLLHLLARHPNVVYLRSELRCQIFTDATADSIVDTYVYYLRRKLGRRVVRTVRGTGYRLGEL